MNHTDLFGGRYRIVGEVGRGGMGVIYRGVDSVLEREVAIKVMSADFADAGEDAKARFLREAKAAAKLQHRNIVTVFEFAEQDGVSYIVMEFLKGRSLASRLASGPPLPLEQKLDVMTELCNGLQYAHENGVIHRDVKPATVWMLEDGTVKLVDFGIAKISSSMMTMRGDVMGSAAYMSPEQIEGHPVTGRSDVFSAAVVLYEMVASRRPFEGDSPTASRSCPDCRPCWCRRSRKDSRRIPTSVSRARLISARSCSSSACRCRAPKKPCSPRRRKPRFI